MKHLFNLILIIAFILNTQTVYSKSLTFDEIKANVKNEILKELKSTYGSDCQYGVTIINVSNQNLEIPEGKINYKVSSNSNELRGKDIKKVDIYVDDKLEKRFIVPVEIQVYKKVLVATNTIKLGQNINYANTTLKNINIADKSKTIVTTLPSDVSSKKIYQIGEVIDNRFLAIKPAVEQRTDVRAFVKNNEVTLTIDAFSLTSGMIGDYVTVQNKNNRKLYRAKVIGLNKVLITM